MYYIDSYITAQDCTEITEVKRVFSNKSSYNRVYIILNITLYIKNNFGVIDAMLTFQVTQSELSVNIYIKKIKYN